MNDKNNKENIEQEQNNNKKNVGFRFTPPNLRAKRISTELKKVA